MKKTLKFDFFCIKFSHFIHQTNCAEGDGWGRKKRQARSYDDVIFDDVNVGVSLSVGTDIDITPSREYIHVPLSVHILSLLSSPSPQHGVG